MSHHLHAKPSTKALDKVQLQQQERQARSTINASSGVTTQPVFMSKIQEEMWTAQQLRMKKEKDKRREDIKTYKNQESIRKLVDVEDQVTLTSFVWQKDSHGEVELKPPQGGNILTTVDLNSNSKELLRHMGQKIDLPSKIPGLKHEYMQSVIQSRSHNFFLSKYAQFKVGVLGKLLSSMNVTPEELKGLQNKALTQAVSENVQSMGENIYNMELAELFHGKSKKAKSAMKMFKEIERQLLAQMIKLGKQDFWNKARLLEERITQLKKIEEELSLERKGLSYHVDFMAQSQPAGY